MRLVAATSALALLALAGCERALIDPLDRAVETVGLDLDEVQTSPALQLTLRVQGATGLTVDGDSAALNAGTGVFSFPVTLARGVNRIAVRATDPTGVVAVDTLVALYLPLTVEASSAFALPSGRTEAAVAAAPGGRVLVSGGVGPSGAALATTVVLTPSGGLFTASEAPLLAQRAGHTASILPGGGVLLVGGATTETPTRPAEFAETVEWVPPGASASEPVALPDGGALRAGHTARVVETGGVVAVYVYGGLVPAGTGVTASGTIDVFEWTPEPARLVRRSPAGGAGAFPALTGHVQVPLALDTGAATGRLVDVVFGGDEPFRFGFTAPGANYPFDVASRDAAPLSASRTDAAGAPLGDGLALVAGGRDASGTALASLEVYAGSVNRTFRLPERVRLAAARFGAGATLLPDGRILVVGGRSASGSVLGTFEALSQQLAP